MKRYLYAFSSVVMAAVLYAVISSSSVFGLEPKDKEEVILRAVKSHLEEVHYSPQNIDDQFSEKVFDLFLDGMDGNKRFLTQKEVDNLSKYRTKLDDQFLADTLSFFNEANSTIEAAIARSERIYEELTADDIVMTNAGTIQMDAEKRTYAKNDKELKKFWAKLLQYDVLQNYGRILSKQEDLQKKIADGKASDDEKETEILSKDEILAKAKEEVTENFEDWFKRIAKIRRSDRFESYVNSITHVYDPHSDYYNPKEKEDFDIRMQGKLEGIGARLTIDDDFTKVSEIVVGGPAWKAKELEADDLITAVKQEDGEPVNIEGMRLDDVVQKIRGKKGTIVVLTIKKPDGTVKDISITRDIVITEEGNAKSVILEMDGVQGKMGYIYLPSFYADFSDRNGRSCSKDIAKEVEKLKAENVDGIIMDIRNNGGGSLRDVVEMGGYFVEEGPMVQVKPRNKKPYVLEDENPSILYDGPMIIMVNEYSVSASEILAAAMQDYKRALIVGSTSTFGKGTVQRFFNLDNLRVNKEYKPLGQVKMTIQKFFRIDGSSTQLKGVVPDIILPDYFQFVKTGEKDYDYPLEWNEIENVEYNQNAYVINNYDELRTKSEARVANDETFKLILENAHRLKKNKDDRVYPLELESYLARVDMLKAESEKYSDVGTEVINGLNILNLQEDLSYIQADSSRIARNDLFIEKLTKDVYLKESLLIMNDMERKN